MRVESMLSGLLLKDRIWIFNAMEKDTILLKKEMGVGVRPHRERDLKVIIPIVYAEDCSETIWNIYSLSISILPLVNISI